MARPPLTEFIPTKNNTPNFGARTRRMYQLLPDFIDDIEADGAHQRGAKLHSGIIASLEDNTLTSINENRLLTTNDDSTAIVALQGFDDGGSVYETKPGYTNTTTSIATDFTIFNNTPQGVSPVPLSLDNTGGYNSINLGTHTLTYTRVRETFEFTMYLAVRVPLGASMELDIHDGDNTVERSGFVIQNSGDTNQEMLVGHFNTRAEFNESVVNSAGGGIYFIKIHIPARGTHPRGVNFRDFNISLAKWDDTDYRVAFAPENNFNNLNINPSFEETGTVATNRRVVSIRGINDGSQLFYAKLISGNILNAF